VSVIPLSGTTDVKQSSVPTAKGDTLYVGGNGTGNYTKIQDAINDASDGDTVFVYSGNYYENLRIKKSICVFGEDKHSTIIRLKNYTDHMVIFADNVTFNGFTIQCNDEIQMLYVIGDNNTISGNIFEGSEEWGIYVLRSEFNVISNNIFYNFSTRVICLIQSNYSIITNNSVICNDLSYYATGIILEFAKYNKVIGNFITGYRTGVHTFYTQYDNISRNTVVGNKIGMRIARSENETVTLNNISNNHHLGVFINNCKHIKIIKNNFFGNQRNSYFFHIISLSFFQKINWNNNYWGEPRLIPYPIKGFVCVWGFLYTFFQEPIINRALANWVNFDWHPAQEPYDIEV